MAVCALMIVGQGLIRTGALEPVGRLLAKLWRKGPAISLLFTTPDHCSAERFYQQHTDRRADAPHPDGRCHPHRGLGVRQPDIRWVLPVSWAAWPRRSAPRPTCWWSTLRLTWAWTHSICSISSGRSLIAGSFATIYLWLLAPRMIPERQAPMSGTVARLYTAQIRLDKQQRRGRQDPCRRYRAV